MARLIQETRVTEKFTEYDLRAKAGSDAETLELAQTLLTHSSAEMTKKVYRRKGETIKATSSPKWDKS